MRIIGGSKGGLVIRPPMKSWPTRPTTDIAKEALYNILMNRIDFSEVTMLDLFGGTGAHTFEFLSRGSPHVTYVDKYDKCASWVKAQIKEFGWQEHSKIIRLDVVKYLRSAQDEFDFIFADPPYSWSELGRLPDLIDDAKILSEKGLMVIEHGNNQNFKNQNSFTEERNYGQSVFSFFKSTQD